MEGRGQDKRFERILELKNNLFLLHLSFPSSYSFFSSLLSPPFPHFSLFLDLLSYLPSPLLLPLLPPPSSPPSSSPPLSSFSPLLSPLLSPLSSSLFFYSLLPGFTLSMLMGTKVAYLPAACFHWYIVHKTFRYFKLSNFYNGCRLQHGQVPGEFLPFSLLRVSGEPGIAGCSRRSEIYPGEC